jgi:hypothetical protein
MTTRVGLLVTLLVTLLGGWLWGDSGRWELDRALRAAELQNDLLAARASVVGARVNLCDADFGEMSRQLEDARRFVARAGARLGDPGVNDEPLRLNLAGLGVEIDEAQRLVAGLNPGMRGAARTPYLAISFKSSPKP